MKAALFTRYGGNEAVEIADIPTPVPASEDVLIAVHAASVNPVDWKVRSGQLRIVTGGRFPKVLGNECAGQVVSAGRRAGSARPGDPVIAWPGVRKLGAFADFVAVPEAALCRKASGISFEHACCLPIAGLTALQALRDTAGIGYGKKVLINGASGGVGHFAVQIAKLFGAETTAVCSEANLDFVRSLGADRAIDYRAEDFAKGGDRYDIIFDAVASRSFREVMPVLAKNGVYMSTLPSFGLVFRQYGAGLFSRRKAAAVWVRPSAGDLEWMQDRMQEGKLRVMIDRTYPLERVREALAYSETGRAKGKIVLQTGARA